MSPVLSTLIQVWFCQFCLWSLSHFSLSLSSSLSALLNISSHSLPLTSFLKPWRKNKILLPEFSSMAQIWVETVLSEAICHPSYVCILHWIPISKTREESAACVASFLWIHPVTLVCPLFFIACFCPSAPFPGTFFLPSHSTWGHPISRQLSLYYSTDKLSTSCFSEWYSPNSLLYQNMWKFYF